MHVPFHIQPCAGYQTNQISHSERAIDVEFQGHSAITAIRNGTGSGNGASGQGKGGQSKPASNREDLYSKPDMSKKRQKQNTRDDRELSAKDSESDSSGSVIMSVVGGNNLSTSSLDVVECERPLSVA